MREVLKQVGFAILVGGIFFAVMSMFGYGESRTGRYSGTEPHWIVIGSFGAGVWAVRWIRHASRSEWLMGTVRALAFLAVGAWFYTGATGMADLTMDSGESHVPFREGVVWVFGAALVGFVVGLVYTGVTWLFRRKASDSYA